MKIDVEKITKVTHVVTHANCPDGYASAAILHYVLPNAQVSFMSYGTKELAELKAELGMLFCDFSPPAERAEEFLDAGAIVLDHHKSAKGVVEMFEMRGLGAFADEKTEPGVSGALFAYRHVFDPAGLLIYEVGPGQRAHDFAVVAGVRDTWQKQDYLWETSCEQAEALRLYGPKVLELDLFKTGSALAELGRVGKLLLDQKKRSVEESIAHAMWKGTGHPKAQRVVYVHKYEDVSDAADAFEGADLVVGFRYLVDRGALKLNFSIRSRGAFDCGSFAKKQGGGGHTKAAGFTLSANAGDLPVVWSIFDEEVAPHRIFDKLLVKDAYG